MPSSDPQTFRALRAELDRLRARLSEAEARCCAELDAIHGAYHASARNLLHYLAVRQVDLRPVQLELWRRGLSSLGRIEGSSSTREYFFGPSPVPHAYVMVTAPDAAEVDEAWVSGLLDAGMNLLRVNGAHEDAPQWHHIVETARRVATGRGVSLRILFDLPGPKLRTVAPGPGPKVERWKPERDAFGRVEKPCRILLCAEGETRTGQAEPHLEIPASIWPRLMAGDELVFHDAREKERCIVVAERSERHAIALLSKTAYLVPATMVSVRRGSEVLGEFRVERVEEQPFQLELAVGQRLRLAPPALLPSLSAGPLPVIGCSVPEALIDLASGARVLFDDGKIECVVERQDDTGIVLRVTHAPARGARIGAAKGINLPDVALCGPALSAVNESALAFAVAEADMVGASFVRNQNDVGALYARLDQLGASSRGVVLKIETPGAFARLPDILMAAMKRYPVGVMIARGDLAVEAGFERLAELQEEILWLCEAAHLPVIWATQVLDRLAHTGTATRAEVTDAAMSVRAECVMLNKGHYIAEAVVALVDILRRMESHQHKKLSLYRKLRLELPHVGS